MRHRSTKERADLGGSGTLGLHQHACCFYESSEDAMHVLAAHLRSGSERGERCAWVVPQDDADVFLRLLSESWPEAPVVCAGGDLRCIEPRGPETGSSGFSAVALVDRLADEARAAENADCPGFRVAMDLSHLADLGAGPDELLACESRLGALVSQARISAVCLYRRDRFSAAFLSDVLHMHPLVIANGSVCQNHFHVPPEERDDPDRAERKLERLLESVCNRRQDEVRFGSQVRLREAIIGATQDGFVRCDAQGRVLEVNEAFAETVGYTRDELRAMRVTDLLADRSKEEIAGLLAAVAKEKALRFETHFGTKDGRLVNTSVSARYIEGVGEPFIFAFCRDVGPERQREALLRDSERRFRELLSKVDLAALMLDTSGCVTFCNDFLLHMLGWSWEELKGQSWFDLALPEGVRERVESMFHRQMASAEDFPAGVEHEVQARDGTRRILAWSNVFLRDSDGRITGTASLGVDTTEARRAEQALRESEERFRELVELLPEIVFEMDMEGNLTFANRASCEMTGYTPEDVARGINILCAIAPEERDRVLSSMQELANGRPVENREYTVLRKDGTRFPALSRSSVVVRDGRVAGLRGILIDITERKKLEEALAKARDFYLTLFETFPAPIWRSDREGRCAYVNGTFQAFTGLTLQDTLRDGWLSSVHPDDLEEAVRDLQYAHEHRTDYAAELRLRRHDGEYRWVVTLGRPCADLDGRFMGYIGSIYDVTDRRKAEDALRESNNLLEALVQSAPVGIDIFDREMKVRLWNPACERMFGWSSEEAVGKPLLTLPAGEEELYSRAHRSVLAGESFAGLETERMRRDGTLVDVRVTAGPVRDATGDIIGGMGIVQDITEQKRAERERRDLEARIQQMHKLESLGVLSGGIAHDFNNLLTGILGYASLALQELPVASSTRECLEEIDMAARRAADLTRQLLAYSGKGRFVTEPVNLAATLRDMGNLIEVSVSNRHRLSIELPDELPVIEADVPQMHQVIMNLTVNASEAIGERDGTIALRAGTQQCDRAYLAETYLDEELDEGLYVYVEVADSGCGMDQATQSRIFEPFFTTKFPGRGLGLAAVLGIVRGHRGAIKVESAVDKGTTVRILFPAMLESAQLAPAPDLAPSTWRGSGTVLVVDDESGVRSLARRVLERAGFLVLTANDGKEAIETFATHSASIRLVLLDMTMPRMDGFETLQELRRLRPDVRVILSSGYSELDATRRFAGQGLAGFVQKPYVLNDLLRGVKAALDP